MPTRLATADRLARVTDFRAMEDAARVQAAITAAHEQAVREGADGYTDPATGMFVFTAAYLAGRGTCCGSGCRHCPYGR